MKAKISIITVIACMIISCKDEFNMRHIEDSDASFWPMEIDNPDSLRLEVIENGDSACFELLDKWTFYHYFGVDINYQSYCHIMGDIYRYYPAYCKLFQDTYYREWERLSTKKKIEYVGYLKKWISKERDKLENINVDTLFIENNDIYSNLNRPKAEVADTVLLKVIEQGDTISYGEVKNLLNTVWNWKYPYAIYSYIMADIYGHESEYYTALSFSVIYSQDKEEQLKGLYYYDRWADYILETIEREIYKTKK